MSEIETPEQIEALGLKLVEAIPNGAYWEYKRYETPYGFYMYTHDGVNNPDRNVSRRELLQDCRDGWSSLAYSPWNPLATTSRAQDDLLRNRYREGTTNHREANYEQIAIEMEMRALRMAMGRL